MNAYIARFAVLGTAAIVVLLWWRRVGVSSKGLYRVSWVNVLGYALWLVLGLTESKWRNDGLVGTLIALPLLAAGLSLIMFVWSRFAQRHERWRLAVSNVLMLILWSSSIVTPN